MATVKPLLRAASLVETIAESLRNSILNGERSPGERIVESVLARSLGVGQPTVREALVALEHEGLVTRNPNQGAEVTQLSEADVRQALVVRGGLELLAVELASMHANEADLGRLATLEKDLNSAAKMGNASAYFTADRRFHEALWSAGGNTLLPKLLRQTMIPLFAFFFLRNLRHYSKADLIRSAKAHGTLLEAIESRKPKHARRVAAVVLAGFETEHLATLEK